jgi:hypothetical protein
MGKNGVPTASAIVSVNEADRHPYRPNSIPYNAAVYEVGNNRTVMDIAQVYPRVTRDGIYAYIFLLDDVDDSGSALGSKCRHV